MQASYPHNRMFNEIVFEGRNKAYGAFFLRHLHERNMVIAIFISLLMIMLLVNIPGFLKLLKGYLPERMVEIEITPVTLEAPPLTTITRVRPPSVEPPPGRPAPRVSQPVTPVVVDDRDMEIETPIESDPGPVTVETGSGTHEGQEPIGAGEDNQIGTGESAIAGDENTSVPFTFVEQMPEFQDGYAGLVRYLRKNLKYPSLARENNISGTVILQFVVTAQGKIKDARVVRGIGGGCDQEALRVVREMPDWKPGLHNGRAVPVTFTLPVAFELK